MTALVWFRRDLRIHNNPALWHACQRGQKVTALYIDCPGQWRQHGMGDRQLDFIQAHLHSLQQDLARLGIQLYRAKVELFRDIPVLLQSFCENQGANCLFANREPEINERQRDKAVSCQLPIEQHWYLADSLVPWGMLQTGQGKMYQVFTPFAKAWCDYIRQNGYPVLPAPETMATAIPLPQQKKPATCFDQQLWPVGETAALQRLADFCRDDLKDYSRQRDFPALEATGRLSPYLAIGVLSPAQCLAAIESRLGLLPLDREACGFSWLNEIIWREFYRHLIYARPGLCKGQAFKAQTAALRWNSNNSQFDAWCQGHTGFPLVDAAMRCLKSTGWMHNRLRMVVASFLTKDLFIDWHRGESWFMSQLLDGDFASNNGGWQWAASTGADAAPYFRIFNPVTQSERFDPQGEFIRQWVPELQNVPVKHIHRPHDWLKQNGLADSYATPLVEHSIARKEAIARFAALDRN